MGEVGDFALAQDLHAIGMDVIEVADQIGPGACCADRHFVKAPFGSAQPGDPFPLQGGAVIFEQDIRADNGGLHADLVIQVAANS